MKLKTCCLAFALFQVLFANAQILSAKSKISIITCAPGDLIYECFGHTAIRIFDPEQDIDYAFNYGIFDFEKPNFGLNFAKGNLEYKLGVSYYNSFIVMYMRDERTITEQVLRLNQQEKQRIFDFLKWNELPENRNYMYDYFYDNCATRVMDVVNENLDTNLVYHSNYEEEMGFSIRDLIKQYAYNNEWSRLGIDLCLGSSIDQKIPDVVYNFLPDYYLQSLQSATKGSKPIVASTRLVYKGVERKKSAFYESPLLAFWLLSFILLSIFIWAKNVKANKFIDLMLFGISGFLGVFLLALWFFTNHTSAAWNFNLIWAMPFNLAIPFFPAIYKKKYLFVYSILLGLLLLVWAWFVQDLNNAFIPLIALIAYRAFSLSRNIPCKKV